MKRNSIPGTISEAKRRRLKVREHTERKPGGLHIDKPPREGICYIGPCEGGVRPVCYFTDSGCDYCVDYPDPACAGEHQFPADDGKLIPKRKLSTKDVVEEVIEISGLAFESKSYERQFTKPIKAFAGVQGDGFIGTANAYGQGTKTLVVEVDFAGYAGTFYRGKVFVRMLF